ncbi:hypothetical protein CC78DRAFT_547392 [Lojkania enalia]|uniref:Uncharacterized protein n=1 Tax=Lojkania enalia TaxID=147567 RepID=A0A9P4K1V8_9PLEO|nr:hypothetical protein CC78DRAFT_547392 [Didymosphaeria enalia]
MSTLFPGSVGSASGSGRGGPQRGRSGYPVPPSSQVSLPTSPDQLLSQIPAMDWAMAEFNSQPSSRLPFRDVPSLLHTTILRPCVAEQVEPDWQQLLSYFRSPQARDGIANLQDLYILLTRVALPNTIIINRRLMLCLYMAKLDLGDRLGLRYDIWSLTPGGRSNPGDISLPSPGIPNPQFPNVPSRAIFAGLPTPDGSRFVHWLNQGPDLPPAHNSLPAQMQHHLGELDQYLVDEESLIRAMVPDNLLRRTARVLRIYWWVTWCNVRLTEYRGNFWVGLENELI